MTYAHEGAETAADIVNGATEDELVKLLAAYGEERFARGIAKTIVERRATSRMLTVGDLLDAIQAGTPDWYQRRRIHAATKTFQALRIATNDEFRALEEGLANALRHLAPGGRLAVITFHSLEDRIVKNMLREAAAAGGGAASKKPVVPSRAETLRNRRARSAKLRVFTNAAAPAGMAQAESMPLLSYV